ncbi:hypothetical protein CLOM_g12069 [Closterium sp. NIES-68]|nr:hypothetical protein CLOM_g12069 [Closterium sp. NIES-68]GJP57960.1 hypothetical protein CLOP_g19876 [Closterium sp. NIES-67]
MSALEKNATTVAGLRQTSRVMGISWSASVGGPRIAGGGTRLGPAAATAGMVLECQKPSLSNSGSRSGGCVQAANDTMPSLSAVPRSGTKSNTKTPDFRRARPMKRPPFPWYSRNSLE